MKYYMVLYLDIPTVTLKYFVIIKFYVIEVYNCVNF